jgi:hypothetical protein
VTGGGGGGGGLDAFGVEDIPYFVLYIFGSLWDGLDWGFLWVI